MTNGAQRDLYTPYSNATDDLYMADWKYTGCHYSPNLNAFDKFYDNKMDDVTNEYCVGLCDAQGFKYSAMQNGEYCAVRFSSHLLVLGVRARR